MFFQPGQATDRLYAYVRDDVNQTECGKMREFCEELWAEYRPYADRHFLSDATNHFHQRFWEMYLAVTLTRKGFELCKVGDEGPEFYFISGDKKIWVEAVAPGPGQGPDAVTEPPVGVGYLVPEEQMILRYTNGLSEKLKAYEAALRKGTIGAADCFIVAINGQDITNGICCDIEDGVPLWMQAFLPYGEYAVKFDIKKKEIIGGFYKYRDSISKKSKSPVSTKPFLEEEYKGISGILHSAVGCHPLNRPKEIGADFEFLHNPLASQPIERSVFSFCRQYLFSPQQGELQTIERNKASSS